MRVVDFHSTNEVSDISELGVVLSTRYGEGVNAFWLSHGNEEYPTLSILVKSDLAVVYYFPWENDAGYSSVGNLSGLDAGKTTSFCISECRGDDVDVLGKAVVLFSTAIEVANEFFLSDRLPRSIEWLRL